MEQRKKIRLLMLTALTALLLAGLFCGHTYGTGTSIQRTVISTGGTYYFEGSMEECQIYVNAGDDDTVVLKLMGVTLTNSSEPAIYIENAGHTSIVLEDNTQNTVQSGTKNNEKTDAENTAEEASDAARAAIYARDDLSITGNGSLKVLGFINNGIQTANHLTIDSGTIEIEAENTGIKGKDSVTITGGQFTITSGGDGIKSNDTDDSSHGVVSISGGTFTITSEEDGIQAETALLISGGEFTITAGKSSDKALANDDVSLSANENFQMREREDFSILGSIDRPESDADEPRMGRPSMPENRDGQSERAFSQEHLRPGDMFPESDQEQEGGTSKGKGLKSNGEITITGGTILIPECYEGLEAHQISMEDGSIEIVSSDDGINACDSGEASGSRSMPNLNILGGTLKINAGGDGIDSNGNITISGGLTVIDGPSDNGNGAIDSGTESGGICTITGGTILALGSSGMAESFDESSTQCSFLYILDEAYEPGSTIAIQNTAGDVLFEYSAVKAGSSIVFSSPDLSIGETFTIGLSGQLLEIRQDSVSVSSGASPGRWMRR